MLSDNIRSYRKKNGLSQDELAAKVGVSRQSVSFWENGQTQPSIDNIIALTKIFHISSDMLLGNAESELVSQEVLHNGTQNDAPPKNRKTSAAIIATIVVLAIVFGAIISVIIAKNNSDTTDIPISSNVSSANADKRLANPANEPFDLFTYCKNFTIEKGTLNGDYCMYQKSASNYGGNDNEYFSISYWSGSDMVEFCLHCPLDETLSQNFYLRMRGGFHGEYEYLSSKYYRDTGNSLQSASGYIDPTVFSDSYPLNWDSYEGNVDGQTEFMEESRIGMCDLIDCLEKFVTEERMECDFSAFEFVNF